MIVFKREFCRSNSSGSRLSPYLESHHRTACQRHVPSERLCHPHLWQLNRFVMEMLTGVIQIVKNMPLGEVPCALRSFCCSCPYLVLYNKRTAVQVPWAWRTPQRRTSLHLCPSVIIGDQKPALGWSFSLFQSDRIKRFSLAGCFPLHGNLLPPYFSLLDVVLQVFSLSYSGTRLPFLKLLESSLL